MVNYQEGLIYKIAHRYSPYVYIGSTTNFDRRKYQHKKFSTGNGSSKGYNLPLYKTIREMGGWDNFEMVLVAKCPCDDKKELHAKEFEYQQLFDVNMNTRDAYSGFDTSDPEYRKKYEEKNKKKIRETEKKYYLKNPEKIKKKLEVQKIKKTCECGLIVSRRCLNRHKESQRHLKLMSS